MLTANELEELSMRGVARGRTLKILYFDPTTISSVLDELLSILSKGFRGRIEGEASLNGERASFLIIVDRGLVKALGVEVGSRVVAGREGLEMLLEFLSKGSGFIEVSSLGETELRVDLEFNNSIAMVPEMSFEELAKKLLEISKRGRAVEVERAPPTPSEIREEIEKKMSEIERSRVTQLSSAELTKVIESFVRSLEAVSPTIPPSAGPPTVELKDLGIEVSKTVEEASREFSKLVPLQIIKLLANLETLRVIETGVDKILNVLGKLKKYGDANRDKPCMLLMRLSKSITFFAIYAGGTLCSVVEVDERRFEVVSRGGESIKKLLAFAENDASYAIYRIEQMTETLKNVADMCVAPTTVSAAPELGKQVEGGEGKQEKRRRGLLSRLFSR